MEPLLVNVPVHRITVPLGIVSEEPASTVRLVNWKLPLVGGDAAQSTDPMIVVAPADPSP